MTSVSTSRERARRSNPRLPDQESRAQVDNYLTFSVSVWVEDRDIVVHVHHAQGVGHCGAEDGNSLVSDHNLNLQVAVPVS